MDTAALTIHPSLSCPQPLSLLQVLPKFPRSGSGPDGGKGGRGGTSGIGLPGMWGWPGRLGGLRGGGEAAAPSLTESGGTGSPWRAGRGPRPRARAALPHEQWWRGARGRPEGGAWGRRRPPTPESLLRHNPGRNGSACPPRPGGGGSGPRTGRRGAPLPGPCPGCNAPSRQAGRRAQWWPPARPGWGSLSEGVHEAGTPPTPPSSRAAAAIRTPLLPEAFP